VIDMTKFRDYKWCSRGILAAVCRCGSRWFQSGFRCFEKISALDGVLKPSSPLTGSTDANHALGRVRRAPLCRWTVLLLGGVGVLAFLLSAVLPDDDTLQQELFHSRTSLRVVGRHTREAAGNAASVHRSTAFCPVAETPLVRPCGITYPLYFAPVPGCRQPQSATCETRGPPESV